MCRIAFHLIVGSILFATTAASAQPNDARKRAFNSADAKTARQWQESSRKLLFELMILDDLVKADRPRDDGAPGIPVDAKVLSKAQAEGFERFEIEFNSTPSRRIKAILTIPAGKDRFPAVVCIHGHGGTRNVVYQKGIYGAFALELAQKGYITIAVDVGQHEVYENGRTLMGERLWDVMRCVDYLVTREEVDRDRIGCAGLSLGGEMAMWLGAMDTRIRATVSAGYLTTVANMRRGHCPCWEFPGLTENFDWADIYCLTAPRALLCQIGQQERAPGGFPVDIAQSAWKQITPCYQLFNAKDTAELKIHPGGHIMEVPSMLAVLDRELKSPARSPRNAK